MTYAPDPDDADSWITSWSAQAAEQAERTQRMAEQVAALSTTGTDRSGLITTTVSSSGVLLDLTLDERATTLPAAQLARQILATMREAQASLTERIAEVVADTVGASSETGRAVIDGYAARFPAPDPDADHDG